MAPLPLTVRGPVTDAVRELRPVVISDRVARDADYPHLAGTPFGPPASYVALPLVTDDRAVGALVLGWGAEGAVPGPDLAFLLALARQSGQALERTLLFEAELAARRSAEHTAARLRLQQDLTAHLSEAVDTAAVAGVIVRYATSALGTRAAVLHRVDERRRGLVRLAAHGRSVDPGPETMMLDADLPVCAAVRAAQSVVLAGAPVAPDASGLVLPLLLDERPVGALSVTWAGEVGYGAADAEFLAAVAGQCAQALDRARLYDETRSVARTLQGSLLPAGPPQIPGVEVAVRYRPISRRNEVGGDFYDVFRIAPGRWGVVVGDVSGKGVPAASLTALARYTVRAAAKREPSPAEVLGFLNEAILDASTAGERFATVAYLDLELVPAGARVRLAVGGHPLPVLRTAGGAVASVGRPGMAIGLLPMAEAEDTELALGAGDTLVLFTDGVTEARSRSGAFAGELVERVLATGGDADAETVADRIERATLDFQDGDPHDDLAVVALRIPPDPQAGWGSARQRAVTLECDPASVAEARRVVRECCREHGLGVDEDVLALLTSEVVTNALRHARTAVGLRISADARRLRVEVSDGSRTRPVRTDAGADDGAAGSAAASGRGLVLLDRLAATWDVRRTPEGKTVWFELELR